MATTKIFSRARAGTNASATAAPGKANAATFDSDGLAEVDNPGAYLAAFPDVQLAGTVNYEVVLDVAGDATATKFTVPSGKQWRLLTMTLELTTDSTSANRNLRVLTRDSGDSTIETFQMATQTSSAVTRYQIVFEDDTQGAARVEPTATLTLAEQLIAGDTMTINGVKITWVAVGGITAMGQIEVGSTEAASKVNINKALGTTRARGNHSISDDYFATLEVTAVDLTGGGANDDMVFTYAGPGSATGDGEALTLAETFNGSTNVWDSGDTTLGGITAGVGAGTKEGSTRFPANGTMLEAGEDIVIDVNTTQDSGDDIDIYFTYLEYDAPIT